MPITVEQDDSRYVVRLEGEFALSEAAELKQRLVEALSSGRNLHLEMEQVTAMDLTAIQLLQLASVETHRAGTGMTITLSRAAEAVMRDAGFASVIESLGRSD